MESWEKDDLISLYDEMFGYMDDDDSYDAYFGVWPKDGSNEDIDDFGDFS